MIERKIEACLAVVKKAIFDDPCACSRQIDDLFKDKKNGFVNSMANSRYRLGRYWNSLASDNQSERDSAGLLLKAQNDLMAGYQLLRLGYNARVIYFIRLALESICQAILTFKDEDYHEKFLNFKKEARADKSIQKIEKDVPIRGLSKDSNGYLKKLCNNKKQLNINSHSTVQAARMDLIDDHPTFGGSYNLGKEDAYKKIEEDYAVMCILIADISDWMSIGQNRLGSTVM